MGCKTLRKCSAKHMPAAMMDSFANTQNVEINKSAETGLALK